MGGHDRPALCRTCGASITESVAEGGGCPECGSTDLCDYTGCAFRAYDQLVRRGEREWPPMEDGDASGNVT